MGVQGNAWQGYYPKHQGQHPHSLLGDKKMWYFAWILGVGLALAFGIINVMWLEAEQPFDE